MIEIDGEPVSKAIIVESIQAQFEQKMKKA